MDAELSEMRQEDQSEKAEGHLTVLSLLSQRSLRWQLISIVILNMGQQLSGVNAVRCAHPVVLVPHTHQLTFKDTGPDLCSALWLHSGAVSVLTTNRNTFLSQIYYYADSIYGSAGVRENDIQYVTVGTGAVNVFMTVTAVGTPVKFAKLRGGAEV